MAGPVMPARKRSQTNPSIASSARAPAAKNMPTFSSPPGRPSNKATAGPTASRNSNSSIQPIRRVEEGRLNLQDEFSNSSADTGRVGKLVLQRIEKTIVAWAIRPASKRRGGRRARERAESQMAAAATASPPKPPTARLAAVAWSRRKGVVIAASHQVCRPSSISAA